MEKRKYSITLNMIVASSRKTKQFLDLIRFRRKCRRFSYLFPFRFNKYHFRILNSYLDFVFMGFIDLKRIFRWNGKVLSHFRIFLSNISFKNVLFVFKKVQKVTFNANFSFLWLIDIHWNEWQKPRNTSTKIHRFR